MALAQMTYMTPPMKAAKQRGVQNVVLDLVRHRDDRGEAAKRLASISRRVDQAGRVDPSEITTSAAQALEEFAEPAPSRRAATGHILGDE